MSGEPVPQPRGMNEDPAVPLALFPGDRVTLRLQSADVSTIEGLVVDERGVLHVPLGGDVEVGGIPLPQAETRIEEALHRFDRAVRVGIFITEPDGHQASVIGAVERQGRYTVVPGMRLADLYAAAGGAVTSDDDPSAPLADLDLARLFREGRPVDVSLSLAVLGDPRHNVRIHPGDHLFVPAHLRGMIAVLGEVNGARLVAPRPGLRLSQALALAGGMTRDANGGDIRIARGPHDNLVVYRAAMDHVMSGEHADPVLAPGDIVLVGSSALADFRDGMGAVSGVMTIMSTTAIGLAIPLSNQP
ncbi:MAG: SLBB domain-containing protein [Sandaracinaceae bacterium]